MSASVKRARKAINRIAFHCSYGTPALIMIRRGIFGEINIGTEKIFAASVPRSPRDGSAAFISAMPWILSSWRAGSFVPVRLMECPALWSG